MYVGGAADGLVVSCFLRVSDHLESICQIFFFIENFDFAMYDIITEVPVVKISEIFFLQIDSKWSKMRKTQK